MSIKLGPKGEALAYRIWGLARRVGWSNLTYPEIAETLGTSTSRVTNVVIAKGWQGRTGGRSEPRGGAGSAGAFSVYHRSKGHRVYDNTLELTDLIR